MPERLVIIDYGSGNLRSAAKALQRAADMSGIALDIAISARVADVEKADRLVLPGVGAFNHCASALRAIDGIEPALHFAVREKSKPFLGICVGMQLMAEEGHEHGLHKGLGWITGQVQRLAPSDPSLKIPHMGWNEVITCASHPVLDRLPAKNMAYFVHSYAICGSSSIVAEANYGGPVCAIVAHGSMIGTQFHPEKSQAFGLAFLAAFLTWKP